MVRWKSKEKAAVAEEEPISGLYAQMVREWQPPLLALLVDTSVVVELEFKRAQILSRACFGVAREAATMTAATSSSSTSRSSRSLEEVCEPDSAPVMWQLGLEEAFFLSSELGCISICTHTRQGLEALSTDEVWRLMERSRREFGYMYMAYAHLRAKHWVVRSGIQYGADFMAYRHHPEFVHSDYSVIVMVEGQEELVKAWTDVAATDRLCRSVAKTLLLLHIILKPGEGEGEGEEDVDMASPKCQDAFAVEAVEVRRWLPEKNRDESSSEG